jgi:protoporphyrinogen IX oxidase
MDWLAQAYPWIKAAHVIAVIAWMAGLLYLPRLFVYHAGAAPGSDKSETFKTMERRLYRAIMHPALALTVVTAVLLLATPGAVDWGQGWLHAKLALGLGLVGLHAMMGRWGADFAADRNRHSARFFRLVNEAPTVLMVLIVILVVVKPF